MRSFDLLLYVFYLLTSVNPCDVSLGSSSHYDHVVQMYLLYLQLYREEEKRERKNRRFWVRPIFQVERRIAQGASDNLIREMKTNDEEKYFGYLRMIKFMFTKLLKKVEPRIKKQTFIRLPIPVHTRLQICLRYLASGDSMASISYAFRVSENTVSKIVRETCRAIWVVLKNEVFPKLSQNEWREIAAGFEDKWNFNHCIGAADGKFVVVQAPPNSGSAYYTYKGTFAINLMAIVDSNYRFVLVDIGAPGRRSDGGVFRESKMRRKFNNRQMNVPPPEALVQNGPALPFVLVGDEAFALSSYMLCPYPRRGNLNIKKKIYNYRLSRARRVVENAFAILAARWRIYRKEIVGSVTLAQRVAQATTCLHNWCINEGCSSYTNLTAEERNFASNGLVNARTSNAPVSGIYEAPSAENGIPLQDENFFLTPIQMREEFADYFSTTGAVSWQGERALMNDF